MNKQFYDWSCRFIGAAGLAGGLLAGWLGAPGWTFLAVMGFAAISWWKMWDD